MRIEVERVLDAAGAKIGGMDKNQQSGWLVVDAYQIMVHMFTAEARSRFGLEQLWRDGREVTMAALEGKPEPKPAAKPARKPAARKNATTATKKPAAKKPAAAKAAPAKKRASKPKKAK
jgi:ribosome-associated protein